MTSADFLWQALLHGDECCIVLAMSMRPPRVLTRSFTLIPAPFTVDVPCSYWTLVCTATLSTLHSLTGQLLQASDLPPASFRPHDDALAISCTLPTAGRVRDFHPLERVPAGHTVSGQGVSPAQIPVSVNPAGFLPLPQRPVPGRSAGARTLRHTRRCRPPRWY